MPATVEFCPIGPTCVWPATVRPVHMRRTARLIRQSDPEQYHLSLMLRGTKRCAQDGRESRCEPYELHTADTSRPFSIEVADHCGEIALIGVEFPKALMPLPLDKVDRLVNRRLPGHEGMGALLASFLTRLTQHTDSFRPTDAPRLQTVLTDLFSAVLAHHLDAETALSPETHQRTLILRIRSFIRQRLHDPRLTPATVAAAHHISTSYLHRVFRAHDDEGT
ncbi:hypothetical protein [Streptomyces sp. NPDC056672]|uniref:AraC-like ligand-binding domain-containing protein n=1 Tax=Streptomyces sp. NPDC056672 TaxID=3345906 RepID=UPI0036B2E485